MTMQFSTAVRNAGTDAMVDLVDGGSANAAGSFKVYTSGDTLLCTITLSNPAFGSTSAGVVSLSGLPLNGTASASGTAAKFKIFDRDNAEWGRGTVGVAGSGADAIIDSTTITSGDVVSVTTFQLTAPGAIA